MGVRKSDSCHEAGSPFHAITKISRILDASTVLMMGVNNRVNEAHHHDPILEASQEHLGDQVMEKIASSWKHSSLSTKRSPQYHTHEGVRCNERVGFVRASNTTRVVMFFSVKSQSCAKPDTKDA